MTKSSKYAQQIIIAQAGTMNFKTWFELSEFSSYPRLSYPSFTVI